METFDVAVIGAGYGGATVAALLAHAGRRVALVEKTPRAGGKTQTLERKGYRYEMFGAVGIPAHGSRFHQLVDLLGETDRVPFVVPEGDAASVWYKAATGEWRHMRSALRQTGTEKEIADLRRVYGATDQDLAAFGALFGAVVSLEGSDLDALDDVGMLGWIRGFGLSEPLVSQLCVTLNTLFVVPVNRLAASEAIFTLKQVVLGGTGRYHVGGYGRVAEVAANYVARHGGRYRTHTRVRRIVIERGRAVGIETDGGMLHARAVISNAGIQPTVLRLAGAGHFPADYVERVRALEPSWAIAGIRYVLDAPVFDAHLAPIYSDQSWLDDERFTRMQHGEWPDVPLIAIDVPSAFDPGLVPVPGHQVANTQVFCSADPKSSMGDEAIERAQRVVDELWPDLRQHVIREERYGAGQISRMTRDSAMPGCGGEAVGLAQVVGQVGKSKPHPRTPLPGLYLVGCDAGGRGAGTHQAVDSGFNVAAMVDDDLRG